VLSERSAFLEYNFLEGWGYKMIKPYLLQQLEISKLGYEIRNLFRDILEAPL
jgi:hypothetical protein